MSMSANRPDGAGLGTQDTLFLHEGDLHPELELAKSFVQNTVLVEVQFPSVGRLEKPEALGRFEPDHACVGHGFVGLDLAAFEPDEILELPSGFVESLANGDAEVTGIGLLGWLSFDHDLAAGHFQVNPDLIGVSFPVVSVGHVKDDPAAHTVVAKCLETVDLSTDFGLDLGTGFEIMKRDLGWQLHDYKLIRVRGLSIAYDLDSDSGRPIGTR
jgi:hypothetical protein